MTARPIKDEDYATICSWWTARGFPLIPKHMLPFPDGAIVDGVAAAFLYTSQTGGISFLEWTTTNPQESGYNRNQALDLVLKELINLARSKGIPFIFTSLSDSGLIQRFASVGFAVSDKDMTNLVLAVK